MFQSTVFGMYGINEQQQVFHSWLTDDSATKTLFYMFFQFPICIIIILVDMFFEDSPLQSSHTKDDKTDYIQGEQHSRRHHQ